MGEVQAIREDTGPRRLGRYLLLKLIAAGGMAEIHLARHVGIEGFRKLLIIKRIHKHLALDPRFVDMFFDEARVVSQLNHGNIVQLGSELIGRVNINTTPRLSAEQAMKRAAQQLEPGKPKKQRGRR